ncbi:MAG: hypothetical protein HY077_05310 [Elusimicrobia bacterium]|nr:hypothetical protein [Elusimicrobiota bacterium]
MIFAAALSSVLLVLPSLPARAALIPEGFINVRANPLPKPQEALLYRNRYQIRSDGSVWSPDGMTQIAAAELPDIMRRLGSNQRLKALLQIDLVLSNSAGEKYLTPSEREEVRRVAKENWAFFTLRLRKNFRGYFSVEELERMNQDPAPIAVEEEGTAGMKDPEPAPAPLPEPEPAAPRPAARAPVPQPVFTAGLPPVLQPLSHQIPQAPPKPAPAQIQAPAPAAVPAPAPAVAPPAAIPLPVAPAPAPDNPVAAALPPGLSLSQSAQQALRQPAPPAAALTPPAVATPPPAPAPPPPPPEKPALPPAVHEILQAEFERWLMDAPYGRDAKAMLRLISEKAPNFARSRALNTILNAMPMIVLDSVRAEGDRHGALIVEEKTGETGYTIALNPGPVFYTKKRLFFGSKTILLSESPKAFAAMHVPVPELEALKPTPVAVKEEQGDWGRVRTYSDGSTRAFYTHQQLAGALLRQLLLLDAKRSGWEASRHAAEVYARSAQQMFYARVADELKDDRFLDPDLRADYHEWLEHPRDWRDALAHSLSSSRGSGFETGLAGPESAADWARQAAAECPGSLVSELTRQELARRQGLKAAAAELREIGLIEKVQFESALKAVDAEPAPVTKSPEACVKHWQDAGAGLRLASALLVELRAAESKFRQERGANAK